MCLEKVISENCKLNLSHFRNVININKNKNAIETHTDSPTAQVIVEMFLLLYLRNHLNYRAFRMSFP
jgi:hypothetical protein